VGASGQLGQPYRNVEQLTKAQVMTMLLIELAIALLILAPRDQQGRENHVDYSLVRLLDRLNAPRNIKQCVCHQIDPSYLNAHRITPLPRFLCNMR